MDGHAIRILTADGGIGIIVALVLVVGPLSIVLALVVLVVIVMLGLKARWRGRCG